WNAEFRSSTGRSAYATTALGESGVDHLQFTICRPQERFVRAWRIGRLQLQPAIIHYQRIGLAQDNGALDDVLQFADIAGPPVSSQCFQRVLSDFPDILASRVAVTPYEILHEQWNVFRSFSQRRNRDWKDIQPVEEILTKGSGRDGGLQ